MKLSSQLDKVRETAGRVDAARAARDEAIRKAHPEETIRRIAEVAGLSPARVHQILHGR